VCHLWLNYIVAGDISLLTGDISLLTGDISLLTGGVSCVGCVELTVVERNVEVSAVTANSVVLAVGVAFCLLIVNRNII